MCAGKLTCMARAEVGADLQRDVSLCDAKATQKI